MPPQSEGDAGRIRQPRVSSKGPWPGADPRTVQGPPDHGHQRGPWLKGGLWGQGAVERPPPMRLCGKPINRHALRGPCREGVSCTSGLEPGPLVMNREDPRRL